MILLSKYWFLYCQSFFENSFDIKIKKERRSNKTAERMISVSNEKQASMQFSLSEEEIQLIIRYWIRTSKIKLGWINDFNKLVVNYTTAVFILDTFCLTSKLLKTFTGHANCVYSIDHSTFAEDQLMCSGSDDRTVRVWNVETTKQIQSFNGHLSHIYCVRFSPYHYHHYHYNIICSSSYDKTIRFWDIKHNRQLQIFNGHTNAVFGIEVSPFNGGKYLCSGSDDSTIRLWDIKTSKLLHIFDRHRAGVWCVAFSPLQSNNNKSNKSNCIGGNGYTICSGSWDKTIRICDIETTKQLIVFKGHERLINSVKYGSDRLGNTILSGSNDKSVRLWDIRSNQQIQVFNVHTNGVTCVEYSPFVVNNIEVGDYSSVICSGSFDNTIRFWDIRSNKKELYVIKGDKGEDSGILDLKFFNLKKKEKRNTDYSFDINLYYSSERGLIRVWG
ncbi:WD-40 repeat protein [Reticulomyxa filosa]|uniref:WD-40 repeat protein n=1 Tax=Reticulomyxa filosa TaxID=46433 RepID=X6LR64_RETFI|nr:WD-40 repeat protein [Reticulomyxa filosa]|eukprot:ETO04358.1 WD-40 repeat protein [Reticulomyxa filosa]